MRELRLWSRTSLSGKGREILNKVIGEVKLVFLMYGRDRSSFPREASRGRVMELNPLIKEIWVFRSREGSVWLALAQGKVMGDRR